MGKRCFYSGKPNVGSRFPKILQRKKVVLLGIPVSERICIESMMSLINLISHPGPVDILLNINAATVIHLARNELVRKALEHNTEYVLFADSDQVYNPDYHLKLIEADKDIIGAPITKRSIPYTLNISLQKENGTFAPVAEFPEDKIFPIDGIGMGFTLIKTKVFKEMKEPWFDFLTLPNDVRLGEDLSFCHKAKRAGFEIWTDPRLNVGHVGTAVYTLDDFKLYNSRPKPPSFENPELISIIIPTRNRYEELTECLETIEKNTVYPNYEIVIVFDGDRKNYNRFNGNYRKILLEDRQEVVKAIHAGLAASKGEIVVNAEDNSRAGKGWLSFAYQRFLATERRGIVVLNDGIQKGNLPIHFLTSKKNLNEINDGYFYSPEYIHFFGDTDLAMRIKGTPKYNYEPLAVLKHLHPVAGGKADGVYNQSMGESWKRDQRVFEKKFNVRFENGMIIKNDSK